MSLINIRDWSYTPLGNEDFIHKLQHEQLNLLNSEMPTPVEDIKKFYDDAGCRNVIDFGCWTGVESFRTFANWNPDKLVLVDGVPLFLNSARDLFLSSSFNLDNVFVKDMCVLFNDDKGSFKDYMLVDENDSYNIASIFSTARSPRVQDPVVLSVAELASPSEAAQFITNLNLDNCFLKLSTLGVEGKILLDLLRAGIQPSVLMFHARLYKPRIKNIFIRVMSTLKLAGYKVPPLSDFLDPGIRSARIMVSKENFYSQIECRDKTLGTIEKKEPIKLYID